MTVRSVVHVRWGGSPSLGGREMNAFDSGASSWSELVAVVVISSRLVLGDKGWSFRLLALEVARRVVS